MSNYEYHTGKLIPTKMTVEEVLKKNIGAIPSYYKDSEGNLSISGEGEFEECFHDTFYGGDYAYFAGIVWEVQDSDKGCNDEITEGSFNPDGSLSYTTRFYNGGCSFTEALEYCYDKAKQEGCE